MKEYYTFSPLDYLMSYQDTHWGSLTPLQRCNQCTLKHQPAGPIGSKMERRRFLNNEIDVEKFPHINKMKIKRVVF